MSDLNQDSSRVPQGRSHRLSVYERWVVGWIERGQVVRPAMVGANPRIRRYGPEGTRLIYALLADSIALALFLLFSILFSLFRRDGILWIKEDAVLWAVTVMLAAVTLIRVSQVARIGKAYRRTMQGDSSSVKEMNQQPF
jgi:hypothetical protein